MRLFEVNLVGPNVDTFHMSHFRSCSWISTAVFSIVLSGSAAIASETDSFTARNLQIKDSLPWLNVKVNAAIDAAIVDVNTWTTYPKSEKGSLDRNHGTIVSTDVKEFGCRQSRLHEALQTHLGNWWVSRISEAIEADPTVEKISVTVEDSIYGKISGISWRLSTQGKALASNIVIDGHYVSLDKIDHFFGQGFQLFDSFREAKDDGEVPLKAAFQRAHNQERGFFGIRASGVRSYGDMTADYNGLKFWSSIEESEKPFVTCDSKTGLYSRTARRFDFKDYLSDAWDEGINCSEFQANYVSQVQSALKERGMTCPVKPEACVALAKLPHAEQYVSPACLKAGGGIPEGVKDSLNELSP